MVVDLLRFEHRIERHDAAAELPGRQQSDEELRHVLEVQRHAVAPRQPPRDKGSGQGIRGAVDLSEGEGLLKVVKERGIGVRTRARPEHLDAVRARRLQVRRDPFWIERQPRSLLVDTAHRCTSYAPEWALLKALVDPVVVGRYPHALQTQKPAHDNTVVAGFTYCSPPSGRPYTSRRRKEGGHLRHYARSWWHRSLSMVAALSIHGTGDPAPVTDYS